MATPLLPSASSVSAVTPTLDELKQQKSKLEERVSKAIDALIAKTPLLNAPPSQLGQNQITWSSNANIYLNGTQVELNRDSKECKAFQAACSAFSEAATKLTMAERKATASYAPTHLPLGMPGSGAPSLYSGPGGAPAASFPHAHHGVPTIPGSLGGSGMASHSSALPSVTPPHTATHAAPAASPHLTSGVPTFPSSLGGPSATHGAPGAHSLHGPAATSHSTPGVPTIPSSLGGSSAPHGAAHGHSVLGSGTSASASSAVSHFGHPPAIHPAAPHGAPVAPAASGYEPYQWTHLENTMLQREIENLQQQQEELIGYKKELVQTIADQSTPTAALEKALTRLYTFGFSNGVEIPREQLKQKIQEVEARITFLQTKINYYKRVQTATDVATKSLRVKILIERQMINQLRNEINKAWDEKHTRTFIKLPVDIDEKEITTAIFADQNVNMTTHLEALQEQAKRLKAILEAAKLLDVKNIED